MLFHQLIVGAESPAPSFGSCEELRAHGVEMDGHYLIDGKETYCKNTWSK